MPGACTLRDEAAACAAGVDGTLKFRGYDGVGCASPGPGSGPGLPGHASMSGGTMRQPCAGQPEARGIDFYSVTRRLHGQPEMRGTPAGSNRGRSAGLRVLSSN